MAMARQPCNPSTGRGGNSFTSCGKRWGGPDESATAGDSINCHGLGLVRGHGGKRVGESALNERHGPPYLNRPCARYRLRPPPCVRVKHPAKCFSVKHPAKRRAKRPNWYKPEHAGPFIRHE
eukprot:scaffold2497_cov119-Isochrysis_galbana.AAC.4